MDADENALTQALRLAASEPAHRPAFYRTLLAATVYIIGGSEGDDGAGTLAPGSELQIQHWIALDGEPVIPFFSSLEALQRALDTPGRYTALPARALFEMTSGERLVLDPYADHGKEFLPDEIEALLADGNGQQVQHRVVDRATQVVLGQPAQYPDAMVAALRTLLGTHPQVHAAWLAQMYDASQDSEPHLLVGIEGDGDLEAVIAAAGTVAAGTSTDGKPVDLYRVVRGDGGGLSNYFSREVEPFYVRERARGLGAKLKSLFGRS